MSYIVVSIDEDGDVRVARYGTLAMSEKLAEWVAEGTTPEHFLGSIPDPDPNYWGREIPSPGILRLVICGEIEVPVATEVVTKLAFE